MTALAVPAYGSPAWIEWRRSGLGASDLPTVMGVDPYRTEWELWREKTGRVPARPETPTTRWGHLMEPLGLDIYARERQVPVALSGGEPARDHRWPHLWATLDGRAGRIGVEVKATQHDWTEPPARVRVQALAQMGLIGLDAVDVVRLCPTADPAIVRVARDDQAIEDVLAAGEAWYVHHVTGDREPALTGGEAEASEEQATLLADLRKVRAVAARMKREDERLVDAIKASMAGPGVLIGDGWRVTYSGVRGRTTTAWQSVAAAYRALLAGHDEGELEALVSLHTSIGEGSTRFVARWEGEAT